MRMASRRPPQSAFGQSPTAKGDTLLQSLLPLLAVLCSAGCALGVAAAMLRRRRMAHMANAAVLGLCAAGSTLALLINPDGGAHAPGVLLLVALAVLAVASALASRNDARWAWFWAGWLFSAAAAAMLLYLWLLFRIF